MAQKQPPCPKKILMCASARNLRINRGIIEEELSCLCLCTGMIISAEIIGKESHASLHGNHLEIHGSNRKHVEKHGSSFAWKRLVPSRVCLPTVFSHFHESPAFSIDAEAYPQALSMKGNHSSVLGKRCHRRSQDDPWSSYS